MSEFVDVVVADLADHAAPESRDGDSAPRLATLLLSRPPTNALTRQVYREITEAAAALDARDDIAAVILFGGHEIFCAGDDMPERATLSAEEAEAGARLSAQAVDAVSALTKNIAPYSARKRRENVSTQKRCPGSRRGCPRTR